MEEYNIARSQSISYTVTIDSQGYVWVTAAGTGKRCLFQVNDTGQILYKVPHAGICTIGAARVQNGVIAVEIPITQAPQPNSESTEVD